MIYEQIWSFLPIISNLIYAIWGYNRPTAQELDIIVITAREAGWFILILIYFLHNALLGAIRSGLGELHIIS